MNKKFNITDNRIPAGWKKLESGQSICKGDKFWEVNHWAQTRIGDFNTTVPKGIVYIRKF